MVFHLVVNIFVKEHKSKLSLNFKGSDIQNNTGDFMPRTFIGSNHLTNKAVIGYP